MKTTQAISILALGLLSLATIAESWRALFYETTPDGHEIERRDFNTIEQFPHQVAVSDLICTGMVLSTNDGHSAEFAVDEVLWGYAASSNITLRPVFSFDCLDYLHEGRFLIMAFTNNWWTQQRDYPLFVPSIYYLHDFISPTSRPPDHAVFEDYRLYSRYGSAIPFDKITVGGTNYWEGTRNFITNFLDIAKIHQDERRAYEWFYGLRFATNAAPVRSRLPPAVWPKLIMYKLLRYDVFNLPPPDKLPKKGEVKEPPPDDLGKWQGFVE